eukprot:Nk52_evm38s1444 gene=Nk52_evmTU38s1444
MSCDVHSRPEKVTLESSGRRLRPVINENESNFESFSRFFEFLNPLAYQISEMTTGMRRSFSSSHHDPSKQCPNPFVNDTESITSYELLKAVLMTILLVPVFRVLCLFFFFIPILGLCFLIKISSKGEGLQEIKGIRRICIVLSQYLARAWLFTMGVYYIKVVNPPSSDDIKKAPIIVANHIGFIEGFILFYLEVFSPVAKADVKEIPFVSTFASQLSQAIFVDRMQAKQRKEVVGEIIARANTVASHSEKSYPRVIVFPQGTTCSYKVITAFKAGAFVPGLPVHPVLVEFPFVNFDVSWVSGYSALLMFYRMLCQFYVPVTVTYGKPYTPSKFEIKNPQVYANNVQELMSSLTCWDDVGAGYRKLFSSKHSWDDYRLLDHLTEVPHARNLLYDQGEFCVNRVRKHIQGVEFKELCDLIAKFFQVDRDGDGLVNFKDFITGLEMEDGSYAKYLFRVMDRSDKKALSLEDCLLPVSSVVKFKHSQFSRLESGDFLFFASLYDFNGCGFVSLRAIFENLAFYEERTFFADSKANGGIFLEHALADPHPSHLRKITMNRVLDSLLKDYLKLVSDIDVDTFVVDNPNLISDIRSCKIPMELTYNEFQALSRKNIAICQAMAEMVWDRLHLLRPRRRSSASLKRKSD